MLITIADTETTGLGDEDRVIELATATYDLARAALVDCCSVLVAPGRDVGEGVHGIAPELVAEYGRAAFPLSGTLLAHNAEFDARMCAQSGIDVDGRWVDSQLIRWPRAGASRRLIDLALAHGVGVSRAHRAIDDVLTLAALLTRAADMGLDLVAEVQRAALPRTVYLPVDTNDNQALKGAGFRWDDESSTWQIHMLPEDVSTIPFAVATRDECDAWPVWWCKPPYGHSDPVKAVGFRWDPDMKHWWRKMPADIAGKLPFAVEKLGRAAT